MRVTVLLKCSFRTSPSVKMYDNKKHRIQQQNSRERWRPPTPPIRLLASVSQWWWSQGLSKMAHQNTNSHLPHLQINHNNGWTHTGRSEGWVGSPFCVTIANEIDAAKNTTEYLCIRGEKNGRFFLFFFFFRISSLWKNSVKYLTFLQLLKAQQPKQTSHQVTVYVISYHQGQGLLYCKTWSCFISVKYDLCSFYSLNQYWCSNIEDIKYESRRRCLLQL